MNVGFAGTPGFAATVLGALCAAGYRPQRVLTQPDRPRGRGMRLSPSPVKALAMELGIAVDQPATLRDDDARRRLVDARLDVLVVAAYGLLLPPAILAAPRHGCINVHASLLPRWRGAAPIQRAILAGDAETGATIMRMDEGLDTGPILDSAPMPIGARDSAGSLAGRLAAAGAEMLVSVLERLAAGRPVSGTAQPVNGITYAAKIDRKEAAIDWTAPAATIDRQIRAFDPAPGAYTSLDGAPIKLWLAEEVESDSPAPPGSVLGIRGDGIVVACGRGALRIEELQPAGGRRMSAAAFAAGRLRAGARFGESPCRKPSA